MDYLIANAVLAYNLSVKIYLNLHCADSAYISTMLATPEIIRETSQLAQLEELLPRWREVPLYRDSFARPIASARTSIVSSACL